VRPAVPGGPAPAFSARAVSRGVETETGPAAGRTVGEALDEGQDPASREAREEPLVERGDDRAHLFGELRAEKATPHDDLAARVALEIDQENAEDRPRHPEGVPQRADAVAVLELLPEETRVLEETLLHLPRSSPFRMAFSASSLKKSEKVWSISMWD